MSLPYGNQCLGGKRSLFGRTIAVTRSKQAHSLVAPLRELGAGVLKYPTIQFEPGDADRLDEAVRNLGSYQWVIFTSVNGVEFFFEALENGGLDARALGNCKLAVIGPGTAARLENFASGPT